MSKPQRRKWSELTSKERQNLQNEFQNMARQELARRHDEELTELWKTSRKWVLERANIEDDGILRRAKKARGPFA